MANDTYNIPFPAQENEQIDLHKADSNMVSLDHARANRAVEDAYGVIDQDESLEVDAKLLYIETAKGKTASVVSMRQYEIDGRIDIAS